MNVQTTILLAAIIVLVVFAAKRVYKAFSLKGGGCACHSDGCACHGGKDESAAKVNAGRDSQDNSQNDEQGIG